MIRVFSLSLSLLISIILLTNNVLSEAVMMTTDYKIRAANIFFFQKDKSCILLSHCFGWTKQKSGQTYKKQNKQNKKK